MFVHPNDEDKYSDRGTEKKDSGEDPQSKVFEIIVSHSFPVCQKSDKRV